MSAISSNFSLPIGLYSANLIASPDATAANTGRGAEAKEVQGFHSTPATAWNNLDLLW